jgi:hypothetical protein
MQQNDMKKQLRKTPINNNLFNQAIDKKYVGDESITRNQNYMFNTELQSKITIYRNN